MKDLINYSNGASNGASNTALDLINTHIHDRVHNLLLSSTEWINRGALLKTLKLSNQSVNRKKYLDPLLDIGWIQLEHPKNLTHPNQRYMITESGTRILRLLSAY